MPPPRPQARGGGAAIALLSVAGVLIGARQDQASLGFVIGLAAGIAIAVALWLWERRA